MSVGVKLYVAMGKATIHGYPSFKKKKTPTFHKSQS